MNKSKQTNTTKKNIQKTQIQGQLQKHRPHGGPLSFVEYSRAFTVVGSLKGLILFIGSCDFMSFVNVFFGFVIFLSGLFRVFEGLLPSFGNDSKIFCFAWEILGTFFNTCGRTYRRDLRHHLSNNSLGVPESNPNI